jgi:hypothetical protein
MNYDVLKISKPAGRIAVREPRVTERLEMLNDLIKLRKGTWDDALYKSILTRATLLKAKRDLVAHGMWHQYKRTQEYHVQLARGSWPKNVAELVTGSKKVIPEGVPMDLNTLRSATTEIRTMIDDLVRLRALAFDAPAPLHKRHRG